MIETPVNLTKKQKELLRQLQLEFDEKPAHSPMYTEWLGRLKKFFHEMRDG